MFSDRLNYGVAKLFTLFVPRSFLQVVRRVLHKAGHHMLARRRHRWISQTWNYNVDVWSTRIPTILSFVVSSLHIFHTRTDGYRPAQMWTSARQRLEIRQAIKRP